MFLGRFGYYSNDSNVVRMSLSPQKAFESHTTLPGEVDRPFYGKVGWKTAPVCTHQKIRAIGSQFYCDTVWLKMCHLRVSPARAIFYISGSILSSTYLTLSWRGEYKRCNLREVGEAGEGRSACLRVTSIFQAAFLLEYFRQLRFAIFEEDSHFTL